MKNHIRQLMVLAALLLSSSAMWAAGEVRIIQTGQGQLSYAIDGTTCTLTAQPADGFYITAEHIAAVKTIEGGSAYAPRRIPGVAEPIAVTATDPDADPYEPTTYTFQMPDAAYDVEVTADFQEEAALLIVNGIHVTERNRLDILKDGGSVQFDGQNMLVLKSAQLTDGGIRTWLDHLVVYLKESSQITLSSGYAIEGNGGELTFTTEGNTPGSLSLSTTGGAVISGFKTIGYEQNLAMLTGAAESLKAVVGTPVTPIVDESGETYTVELGGAGTGEDPDLENVIIDNVLYTLDKGNEDGIDRDDHCVVLGSTMTDDDVDDIINTYQPGTDEFASHFAGLTFMVPAGYGRVIIKARTGEAGVLHVKIGTAEPYVITGALDFQEFSFPYACTEATYVYVYSNSPVVEAAEASDHRAGKKTTVTVGVGSVGVSSGEVQGSNGNDGNAQGGTDVVLSDDSVEYDEEEGTLTSGDASVTVIADDAFINFPFLKYIDLRGTSITGLHVSRSEGPFNGVSKNTFIYLPAGNSSDEPNVIIGNVCQQVVLDGQMKAEDGESFGLSGSFIAQQVVFDRPFTAGETVAVYLPFDMTADEAAQYGTFYTFDTLQQGSAQLVPSGAGVQAHTPYVFKAAAEVTLKSSGVMLAMPFTPDEPTAAPRRVDADPDGLYGTYEFLEYDPFDADVFRLATSDKGDITFERLQEDEAIRPFECYLYAFGQTADSFGVQGEGISSSVRTIRTVRPDYLDAWYGLSGLPVRTIRTTPGVYIRNGQKTVVR